MTKPDKIDSEIAISWRDIRTEDSSGVMLATQILNVMEQGIIVWSADSICELYNTRIFEVFELDRGTLTIGTSRDDFLDAAFARGGFPRKNLDRQDAPLCRTGVV